MNLWVEPMGITRYVPVLCGVGLTFKQELKKEPFINYVVGPKEKFYFPK
jgi:hypothetical protein